MATKRRRTRSKVAVGGTSQTGLYRGRKGPGVGYPRPKLPRRVDRDRDGVVVERKATKRRTGTFKRAPARWVKRRR